MTKKKELSVKVGDRKDGLEGESRASEQASQRPRVKDVRRIKGNPLILLLRNVFSSSTVYTYSYIGLNLN